MENENPYAPPSVGLAVTRRPLGFRHIPAIICFMFGALLTVGNAIALVVKPFLHSDGVTQRVFAGHVLFVAAGILWWWAGRKWVGCRWWHAVLLTIVGYGVAVSAAHLID